MDSSCLPILSTKSPKTCSKKLPFTSSERELIIALVRERPIIEDKRTNSQNIELKKKAWGELTMAYNAQCYVTPRNNTQLKRCWENMKSQRKKELSFESISMKRTGGGSPEVSDDLKQSKEEIKKQTKNNVLDFEVESDKPVYKSLNTKNVTNFYDSDNFTKGTEGMNVDTNFISDVDKNVPSQPKKRKEISSTSTGLKKCSSEIEAKIIRCSLNMQQDLELHECRLKRERLLIKREENLIEFEKQLHALQLEKMKMEIELLKKQLEN